MNAINIFDLIYGKSTGLSWYDAIFLTDWYHAQQCDIDVLQSTIFLCKCLTNIANNQVYS